MQIKDGQKLALIKLCQRFTPDRGGRLYLISKLLGREITTTDGLTVSDWQIIRNQAYPNWSNDNWEAGEEFKVSAQGIIREYEREVLGQGELFR